MQFFSGSAAKGASVRILGAAQVDGESSLGRNLTRRLATFLLFTVVAFPFALSAQTIPHVTGTFKTPENNTPSEAGLRALATIGATPVYGSVDFVPTDTAANRPTRILYNGVTYPPQPVRAWIKGDGTLVDDYTAAAGVDLVPTIGATPTGLALCAVIRFSASTDGFTPAASWTECKEMPAQASVNWGDLPVAAIVTPAFSYQLSLNGAVTGHETWTGISTPANPGAGSARVWFDSGSNLLKCITSAAADCAPGGGGSLTTREVDAAPSFAATILEFDQTDGFVLSNPSGTVARLDLNLSDAHIPDTITINLAAAATALAANPADCAANQFATTIAASGALTCAAIADADVPDTITASNYLPLTGGVLTGNLSIDDQLDLRLREEDAGGDNFLGFRSPAAIAAGDEGVYEMAPLPASAGFMRAGARAAGVSILTVAAIADADVPDTITINLAAAATALAANPADCAANQFATTIAASGALTCAAIADADVPDTITINLATAASDLTCTNCIGPTEITDLTLGTDTAGNYVASVATNGGLTGGAAGSEGAALTIAIDYAQTLAGNPALAVSTVIFSDDCSGGGFLSEGSTANTNEQLYCLPAVDGADTTVFLVADATQVTDLEGVGLTVNSGTLDCDTASLTVVGCAELATAAETTTGTDATRAVTPDGLAGSIHGKKNAQMVVFDFATAVAVGDGKFYFYIPADLNGMNLVGVTAAVVGAVSSSGAINVDLARCAVVATGIPCSGTVADILSTNLTIDANEDSSSTAATAAVISGTNDDVATDQMIRVDVDGAGTGTQGLIVNLEFQTP